MQAKDLVGKHVSIFVEFPGGYVRREGTVQDCNDKIGVSGLLLDKTVELQYLESQLAGPYYSYDAREQVTA